MRSLLKVFLNMFCLSLGVHVASPLAVLSGSEGNPTALSDQELTVTPQEIRIQVKERALQEVLQHIQRLSGIHFLISHTLEKTSVTATVDAHDWPTAIRQLLRPFNTAEVWDQDGKKLHRVWIIGYGQMPILPIEAARSSGSNSPQFEDAEQFEGVYLPEAPPTMSLPPPPLLPPSPHL